jgi:hypothetical protein
LEAYVAIPVDKELAIATDVLVGECLQRHCLEAKIGEPAEVVKEGVPKRR